MNFLIDHNLRGQAVLLSGILLSRGWLDWVVIQFITFDEMNLSVDIAPDRPHLDGCENDRSYGFELPVKSARSRFRIRIYLGCLPASLMARLNCK
jgi:hypothetical protein